VEEEEDMDMGGLFDWFISFSIKIYNQSKTGWGKSL
jgi:hypothetical protein